MADTTTEPKAPAKNVTAVDLTPEVYQRLLERTELLNPKTMPAFDDPGVASYQQNVELTEGRISDLARRVLGQEPPTDVAEIGAKADLLRPAGATGKAAAFPQDQVWENVEQASKLYRERAAFAEEMARKGLEASMRQVIPATEGVKAAARTPQPPVPQMIGEPPIPPTKPKPFVTAEGQNAVLQVIGGLGAITQAIAGWRAPIGGLNAMQGMMVGWQEGDADRVAREMQKYEAEVQKMTRENTKAMELYEVARTRRSDDIGAAQIELQAALAHAGLFDHMAAVAEKGVDHAGQVFNQTATIAQKLATQHYRDLGLEMRMSMLMMRKDAMGDNYTDAEITEMAEWARARGGQLPAGVLKGYWGPSAQNRVNKYLMGVGVKPTDAALAAAGPDPGAPPPTPAAGATPAAPGQRGRELVAGEIQFRGEKKESDTLATRQANMEQAVVEAESLIPMIKTAYEGVIRTGSPFLNRFVSSILYNVPLDKEASAGEQKLMVAINTFIPVYVRAMKGTGVPDVTSQEHARDMLSKNLSAGQLNAALEQLHFEMQVAQKSPEVVRQRLMSRVRGEAAPAPATTPPPGAAPPPAAVPAAAAPPRAAPAAPGTMPTINSQQEYDALPPGTPYLDSDGKYGVK